MSDYSSMLRWTSAFVLSLELVRCRYAERLLSQRRESATNKAQTTLRRVRDRKTYFKLKKERDDAKRQVDLQAENSLLRAVSGVAEAMMDDDEDESVDEHDEDESGGLDDKIIV
jgi:hypothetical protein